MGDSITFEDDVRLSLTNGDVTPPSLQADVTPSTSMKSSLVHSNGSLKAHKSDVKHHVKFCEEHTVTEVERSVEHNVRDSQMNVPRFSVLTLDDDGFPVYDIDENVVETVTETQFKVSSPGWEEMSPREHNAYVESSPSGVESSPTEVESNLQVVAEEADDPTTKTVVFKGPVIRLQRWPSAESHENPFQYDGELSKKADFIVRNSTISRTEVLIADPDKGEEDEPEPVIAEDQILVAQSAPVAQAAPDCVDGPTRPNDIKVKENGNIEEAATPQSVEIEVGKAEAAKPEVQEAEEVNIPKKRGKCCVLQ